MKKLMIEIQNYCFRLGKNEILKNISLDVREGEYLSIVGPNGAGKTTLLKCLSRIWRGGSGTIRVAGRPLDQYKQRELARMMSYVPQADGRFLPFTVYEFVMMGRYPHLSPFSSIKETDESAVEQALGLTGTGELSDRLMGTLSGGERQKVLIAAALAQGAGLLLLDEPTCFLDPKHQAEILMILRRVNEESGATILSVTHDINSAVLWSRRVVALRNGAIAFCGPAEEIMNNEVLEDIYGIRFQFLEHPQTGKSIAVQEGVR